MKFYSILVGGLLLVLSGCTIMTPVIQHTSIPYVFPNISFYSSQTGMMQQLMNQGVKCIVSEIDDSPSGNSSCDNVPGYLHRYDIPKWNISISGMRLPQSVNTFLFESNPEMPLIISGNKLYDKVLLDGTGGYHGESYIEYVPNSHKQTPEEIIATANDGLMGDMMYKSILLSDLGDYVNGADVLYRQMNLNAYKETIYYFSHKHPEYYYISYSDYCAGTSSGRCNIFGRGTRLFVDN